MRGLGIALRAALVAALLLLGMARHASAFLPGQYPGEPPVGTSSLTRTPKYVFVFVLDGGLPSYFSLGDFPHLKALQRSGTTYTHAWDGMLETETPTGHATLGTGSLPRRHGVISFSWVTDTNVHEHPTNPDPIQQGQLETVLKRSGVPSLASALHRVDPAARVAVTSGHKDYAVDSVGGPYADYLMFYHEVGQTWTPVAIPRHVPPQPVLTAPGLTAYAPHMGPGDQDSLAVNLALSTYRNIHPRVTIVNLPEFDWPLGHLLGGRANGWFAWKLMSHFDADLGALEAQLQQDHALRDTLFVFTADHGMLTLNHQIPHDFIQNAVAAAGTTLEDYDFHTSGYLWLHDRSKAPAVATKLLALRNPGIRAVYYRRPGTFTYVRATGGVNGVSPATESAYQFLLSTLAGPSAPQVVLMLKENTSIRGRNQTDWKGDHGGSSWNAEHIPLILSGPGVRQGVYSPYPATLYDITPTILDLLGASSAGMDGVVLADGLIHPYDGSEAAQAARGASLQPITDALRTQSHLDGP